MSLKIVGGVLRPSCRDPSWWDHRVETPNFWREFKFFVKIFGGNSNFLWKKFSRTFWKKLRKFWKFQFRGKIQETSAKFYTGFWLDPALHWTLKWREKTLKSQEEFSRSALKKVYAFARDGVSSSFDTPRIFWSFNNFKKISKIVIIFRNARQKLSERTGKFSYDLKNIEKIIRSRNLEIVPGNLRF